MFRTFANKVKIKESPETLNLGLAGRIGVIYGETTPSIMGIEVIGDQKIDYALNVYFEDTKEMYWFSKDLLETIDNSVRSEITLDGIDKKWIKNSDGVWIESENKLKKKSWWRFW